MPRAPRNRLYRAWLALEAADANNADQQKTVGPARALFLDWVTSGRPSYFDLLATAPANVREAFSPLRALASICTPAEIEEFVELARAPH
jgi:hypothetical protein